MDRRKALKGLGLSFGYVIATPTIVGILHSCKTDAATWTPTFFTSNEGVVIKNFIDLILPNTEALPGALDVNVPEFLDQYASKVYTQEKQNSFKEGLREIMSKLNISTKNMSELKKDDYDGLLAKYLKASKSKLDEFKSNEEDTRVLNALQEIRSTTIWAYKTSEQIGENVLAYDPIPGKQIGCMSLEEATGGKVWSLQ